MNPFDFLPHNVDVIFPEFRIGNAFAKRRIKARQAIEYLRTGLYRETFSLAGEFVGLIYSPQTAKPAKPYFVPEDMPMLELPGIKFRQPLGASAENLRTVSAMI